MPQENLSTVDTQYSVLVDAIGIGDFSDPSIFINLPRLSANLHFMWNICELGRVHALPCVALSSSLVPGWRSSATSVRVGAVVIETMGMPNAASPAGLT